jgi:mono/diheme cytochrome c family protein
MSDRTFAVVGLFHNATDLMAAIPGVRARRLGTVEAYTPYPIHGIETALGLRRSPLGGMVMVAGILGCVTALFFEWWMSAVDYPIVVGGKALFSWQAFVPIMFEVTVLFATFTAGLGMLLLLNKLPFFGHPMLSSQAIAGVTRDKFALAVEADNGTLDVEAAMAALRAAGATALEVLFVPAEEPVSLQSQFRTAAGIVLSCAVAGYAMYWAIKLFPVMPPMLHMEDQPRLDAQRASTFFKDGHGMQQPVEGTVARGQLPYLITTPYEAGEKLVNPLPRTASVLQHGRVVWNQHCAVCHGALGNGVPTLTSAYGAKPANLLVPPIRDYPDGKIYHTIMVGKNAMPSYAADLTEDERWAVIHYVRALQRAQNAKDEDFK